MYAANCVRRSGRRSRDVYKRQEHQQDFFYIVDGSFLEEYDEFNIGVQFKAAATVSILILRQGHPDIARHHAVYAAPPGGGHAAQQQSCV